MAKIFESPDGGHTIYSRESGSDKKVLEYRDEWASKFAERFLWEQIYDNKDQNPALKKAVENIIILYKLIEDGRDQKT